MVYKNGAPKVLHFLCLCVSAKDYFTRAPVAV